ncbi:SDR family NAD(P)-dependent oxidoreductase [Halalkalibacter kiskunsagensis]|uniref:SDR family NAD(P)-dependent oxidoreductase n=1 Tax=Halalkalibacter kiskunsagensis TaxID=1548599 RepID=A0ABV6KJG2_9BACI
MATDKVIWITGASSGLGRELALEAGKNGNTVVLLARNVEKLHALQQIIEGQGAKAFAVFLDMSDTNMIAQVTEQIVRKVGKVDVLINNAGFGVFEKVEQANMQNVQEMFAVNVVGLIALTNSVLPHMLEQNKGHIINIASQAGKLSTPKSSVYAATKHAVLGFTNGLRMEMIDTNIHISAVNPGPIRTPFFDRADKEGTYVKNIERWMLDSQDVAKATIKLIDHPKRELNLPRWMNAGSTLYQLMPSLFERLAGRKLNRK